MEKEMDYVFTLSKEAEVYTVQGVGNLDRPVPKQIRFHVRSLSAADHLKIARVAAAGAGEHDDGWQDRYLGIFQEETFVAQIEKVENIYVRDAADGDIRQLTDAREILNSNDPYIATIASEVEIWMSSRVRVPEKNLK